MPIGHANRNKLDNSRTNLRICSRGENTRNRAKPIGCSSRFKGVCYEKKTGKWKASVGSGRKRIHLGTFNTEEEAARAYDAKAVELFGKFARLNFPEEWPAKRRARVRRRKDAWKARTEGKGLRTGKSSKTPRVTGHRTRAATRGRSKRKSHDKGRKVRR